MSAIELRGYQDACFTFCWDIHTAVCFQPKCVHMCVCVCVSVFVVSVCVPLHVELALHRLRDTREVRRSLFPLSSLPQGVALLQTHRVWGKLLIVLSAEHRPAERVGVGAIEASAHARHHVLQGVHVGPDAGVQGGRAVPGAGHHAQWGTCQLYSRWVVQEETPRSLDTGVWSFQVGA